MLRHVASKLFRAGCAHAYCESSKMSQCVLPHPGGVSRVQKHEGEYHNSASNTVDGRNPAPPRMMIIPLFIGF